jgi:hypothetical protein
MSELSKMEKKILLDQKIVGENNMIDQFVEKYQKIFQKNGLVQLANPAISLSEKFNHIENTVNQFDDEILNEIDIIFLKTLSKYFRIKKIDFYEPQFYEDGILCPAEENPENF